MSLADDIRLSLLAGAILVGHAFGADAWGRPPLCTHTENDAAPRHHMPATQILCTPPKPTPGGEIRAPSPPAI